MSIFIYFITASWAAFILYWIFSAFSVKRDVKRGMWWRFAWLRMVVILIILSFLWSRHSLGVLPRAWEFVNSALANIPLAAVGAALSVMGIGYAIWARVHLGRNWSPSPNLKEEHELITSGPYTLVRHPIYTGIIVAALGTSLVIPLWIFILIIVLGTFIWRVHVEEAIMTKQFPNQYPEYKKRTWALIPFVW